MVVNVDSLLLVPSIPIVASQLCAPRALGRSIDREREVQVKKWRVKRGVGEWQTRSVSALWAVPHHVGYEFLHHPMGPLSLSIRLTVAGESQLVTEESRNRPIEGTSG